MNLRSLNTLRPDLIYLTRFFAVWYSGLSL
jgi:hypothetical protein